VLVASYDEESGPALHAINPDGVCYRYFGVAIGKYKQGSESELEKIDFANITCKEAVNHVARM
jgi:20S proteasome subunit alpha 7